MNKMFADDFLVDISEISDIESPLVPFPAAKITHRRGTKLSKSSFKSPLAKRIRPQKVWSCFV